MIAARIAVLITVVILLGAIALAAFGRPSGPRLTDDDYIAIAISQPAVFHPTGQDSGSRVRAEGVEHTRDSVIVNVVSDGIRFQVIIDPETNKVTRILRQAP